MMPNQNAHRISLTITILLLAGLVVAPAWGQRNLKNIPPPDPELERKSFIVADGFEVNLYAADPAIAKPIQMNFDPQGRLWIASSEVYPHIKPGQKANDRILIVEDRDGDGVAEKTTVFADGLLIPTGVEPGDGGVYVAASTELLHLRDTDGDSKADQTRIVLSGFGTEDTHHILHTCRWGPDGMLYFNQSIYIHSHLETPYGVKRLNGGGIWQFRPETMRLDVYARGWVNTWGHHFDRYGQSFVTDGAGGQGINFLVQQAAYQTAVGVPRLMRGLNPGSPKYCGLEIVSGRHLPDDWQGNLITNDFRGHRVCRYVVSDDGSGFAAREQVELIKTKHVAFRPIDIKMGPDGAIYIADWYNPIIQHGEVDFFDPRRDHVHGRIWRVTYKGRPLVKRPELVGASTESLLEYLKAPEDWTRRNAKRVLKERGVKEVIPQLRRWVAQLDPKDDSFEHDQLEALWMFQSLEVPNQELLRRLLRTKDPRVRAAATRVVQHWQDRLPNLLELLAEQVEDEHPRVRLDAVRVLGNVAGADAVAIAMRALNQPVDRFLDYSLWLTAWDRRAEWLPLVKSGKMNFDGNARHLTFALKSAGSTGVAPLLVQLLKTTRMSPAQQRETADTISLVGNPKDLGDLLKYSTDKNVTASMQISILATLAKATQQRKIRPAGNLQVVGALLKSENPQLTAAAARCAGVWKLQAMRDQLQELAERKSGSNETRSAAIAGLGQLGGIASQKTLNGLTQSSHSTSVRIQAVSALALINFPLAAQQAVVVLSDTTPTDDPSNLFSVFLGRRNGPAVLQKALNNKRLPEDVAKLGLRVLSATGRPAPALENALRKAGGIKTGPKMLSPSQLKAFVQQVDKDGDAHRGQLVFRRSELACLKCHAIGGAGGRVGPDMISLGASAQVDYLIESLLQPSKKVKENYNTLVVATDAGEIISGIKLRQTNTNLILRDAEDKEITIPLASIEEQKDGASIMPIGLVDKLTQSELIDLVRFLSELGKLGDFAITKARVVRRWQTLRPTPESNYRIRRTRVASTTSDDPAYIWMPRYSTVGGVLPLAELPEFQDRNQRRAARRGTSFVRFELDVTTAGRCSLVFNSLNGMSLFVDTDPIEAKSTTILDLKRGRRRITLVLDRAIRMNDLRIELQDVEGSAARAQIVRGK